MAQLADHELVTLIELAALDRAGDHVGDCGQERDIVLAEAPPPGRVRTEHPIGASVAARDRDGEPADGAVLAQQRLPAKSGLGREIVDDHRAPGGERIAGLRIAVGRQQRGPDQAGIPSGPGPQQELGVAGNKLEDLHQFDIKRVGDGLDAIIEEALQAELGQRLGGESCHRFLLLGADAKLAMVLGAVGHLAAEAEQLHRRARLSHDGGERLDPALVLAGPGLQPILHAPRGACPQRLLQRGGDGGPIVGMDIFLEDHLGGVQAAVRESENILDVARPSGLIGWNVPRPNSDLTGFERDADQPRIGKGGYGLQR